MFASAGKSITGSGVRGSGLIIDVGGGGGGGGGAAVSSRRDGGPVLNSFGQVLVSDSSYAHHSMSIAALKNSNLKFSPGLGQQQQDRPRGGGRLSHATSFSPKNANVQAFMRRDRYNDNHSADNDDDDDDDGDDHMDQLRRSRRADSSLTKAIPVASTFKPFDPKTNVVTPRVPRAADAALHKPGGGEVKIFSQKLDLSHVQAKVPRSTLAAPPRPSEVAIWNDTSARTRYAHVTPKVPTAEQASAYKPGGGNIQAVIHRKLDWHAETTLPITAAEASKYKAKSSDKTIFHEKVDFDSHAQSTVPSAADARLYRRPGGQLDVLAWSKPPESRRPPPPKKTEAQIREELFPDKQQQTTRHKEEEQYVHEEEKKVVPITHATPYTVRKRRELLLHSD